MRRASFAMTGPQCEDRTKTQTRRLGWRWAKPGMQLTAMLKTRGVRRGEGITYGTIEIVDVRREPLNAITPDDVVAEGFPGKSPEWFVEMFCKANRCAPDIEVARIAFRWIEVSP